MPYTTVKGGFVSYEQAKKIVQQSDITTSTEYRAKTVAWREANRLPSNPHITYARQWESWPIFTGYKPDRDFSLNDGAKKDFVDFDTAREILAAEGVDSQSDYLARGKEWREALGLPRSPCVTYSSQWRGWPHFCGRTQSLTGRWSRTGSRIANDARTSGVV